jgi:hypothetical protein
MMRGPYYSLRALDLLNARAKRHSRRRTNHRGARIIGVTMLVKWGSAWVVGVLMAVVNLRGGV